MSTIAIIEKITPSVDPNVPQELVVIAEDFFTMVDAWTAVYFEGREHTHCVAKIGPDSATVYLRPMNPERVRAKLEKAHSPHAAKAVDSHVRQKSVVKSYRFQVKE